jgi:hypothetical protein
MSELTDQRKGQIAVALMSQGYYGTTQYNLISSNPGPLNAIAAQDELGISGDDKDDVVTIGKGMDEMEVNVGELRQFLFRMHESK